ncbi:hypothetical protein PybrP1_003975 [[Pythium] brassicae (nom. inval.)]|nr:hypothetical protein PybrP1_003975 [[Pythium] brassicae (nom. inval.)]
MPLSFSEHGDVVDDSSSGSVVQVSRCDEAKYSYEGALAPRAYAYRSVEAYLYAFELGYHELFRVVHTK